MIVYTRGRVPNSDQDYRATEDSEFTDIPIVLIANRNSASASEIVTGALQDHDRAYIVGETTFGKALVQSVYRISGGAGLALTTAHYYTPSGRLIQRPWDATFDEYQLYRLKDQDANRPHNPSDLKRTDAGRPVYSGGGIEPDKRIAGPIEGFNPTPLRPHALRALGVRQLRAEVRGRRRHAHRAAVSQPQARETELRRRRRDGGRLPRAARRRTRSRSTRTRSRKDLEFIKAMIRFEIDNALFGIADARRHLIGGRSAGAGRTDHVRRGAEADRAGARDKTKAEPLRFAPYR